MLYGGAAQVMKAKIELRLNPYFFGKCSTATKVIWLSDTLDSVLILIFLENALRL